MIIFTFKLQKWSVIGSCQYASHRVKFQFIDEIYSLYDSHQNGSKRSVLGVKIRRERVRI
jgi:hypothetical protein